MLEEIREQLYELGEADYKVFNDKLIPGTTHTIGIRMPKLRELAKKTAREDYRGYLEEVSAAVKGTPPEEMIHEEALLYGMVIGYGKMSLEERFYWLDQFVPRIYNWAICDSCCMTYQFMKKEQEASFAYLKKYLDSGREYEIRFAVVCLLDHFVNETYIDQVLAIMDHISHEGYYVKMAVAWAVSVCYVHFPEKTEVLLRENHMDDFTHNKAIQKIRESYRVSKEKKEELKTWKRQ